MKLLTTIFFSALIALPALAERPTLARKSVRPALMERANAGKLAVALYKAEMAKPDSALSKAMKPFLDDASLTVTPPEAKDILFFGGSNGNNGEDEEYTATYMLPIYYGFKSGTWPLVYLEVFTANSGMKAEISIERLVDLQAVDIKK